MEILESRENWGFESRLFARKETPLIFSKRELPSFIKMGEERQQFLKGLKYHEMSNVSNSGYRANHQLVMSADKRERGPRESLAVNGEPESLAGRIHPKEMGSRLPQAKAPAEKP